jgi:hypothetical protein
VQERNWFHAWGIVLWVVLAVAGFWFLPGSSLGADAFHALTPLVLLGIVGAAVLASIALRRRS